MRDVDEKAGERRRWVGVVGAVYSIARLWRAVRALRNVHYEH